MNGDYAGRTVVVTGGTGALGCAVVGGLLGRGGACRVPCFARDELERFPFAGHERVEVVSGVDLRDERAAAGFFEGSPSLWASIHVAGGFEMAAIADTSLEAFRRMFEMNAATCFLCCREAVKRMRRSGAGSGGRIVNVAARPAIVPAPGMIAYTTAKAAVASMTLCLAEELKDEGIWVNAVVPSIMDTPANRAAMPGADHGSWPSVESVAETILFLASPRNTATRGALAPVYGRS